MFNMIPNVIRLDPNLYSAHLLQSSGQDEVTFLCQITLVTGPEPTFLLSTLRILLLRVPVAFLVGLVVVDVTEHNVLPPDTDLASPLFPLGLDLFAIISIPDAQTDTLRNPDASRVPRPVFRQRGGAHLMRRLGHGIGLEHRGFKGILELVEDGGRERRRT